MPGQRVPRAWLPPPASSSCAHACQLALVGHPSFHDTRNTFTVRSSLPTTSPRKWDDQPHSMDESTETQRGLNDCPQSHRRGPARAPSLGSVAPGSPGRKSAPCRPSGERLLPWGGRGLPWSGRQGGRGFPGRGSPDTRGNVVNLGNGQKFGSGAEQPLSVISPAPGPGFRRG